MRNLRRWRVVQAVCALALLLLLAALSLIWQRLTSPLADFHGKVLTVNYRPGLQVDAVLRMYPTWSQDATGPFYVDVVRSEQSVGAKWRRAMHTLYTYLGSKTGVSYFSKKALTYRISSRTYSVFWFDSMPLEPGDEIRFPVVRDEDARILVVP